MISNSDAIYRGTSLVRSPLHPPDHRRAIGVVGIQLSLRGLRLRVSLHTLSRTTVQHIWRIEDSQCQIQA